MTLRQLFYRLVGAHDYPKEEQAYRNLSETINRARRSGRISWEAIRDDGIAWHPPYIQSDDIDWHLRVALGRERRLVFDRQEGQALRLIIGVEAAGIARQVARVAGEYGVPVFASGGFDSVTFKYDFAQMLKPMGDVEVLHVGDYDRSGETIFDNLRDDVGAMVRDLGNRRNNVAFTRLAVTPDQISEMGLPTSPAKATDRRRTDITETVQAEAIAPDVLQEIVRSGIEARQNDHIRQVVLSREIEVTAALNARLSELRRLAGIDTDDDSEYEDDDDET